MSSGRYRKLYYVPGLISLILVPLLLSFSGQEVVKGLDKTVLEISMWNPAFAEHSPFPNRDYQEVKLIGDEKRDAAAIENGKHLIKNLYDQRDTTQGIHFALQDSASYGTFVHLLNFFKTDSIPYYIVYNKNIWVLYTAPSKPDRQDYRLICGNSYLENVIVQDSEEANIFAFISPYEPSAAKLWPVLATLLLLILASFKSMKHILSPPSKPYFRKL
ncbi:hypothetical protein [Pontibacter akesuensis]|uniref:Uncharacterized protein n=1 Tax=Pontibacter akesuensis TaxID=388950 RepID=A0A1I7II67_9BACT|nr:hypothetical protein [Pontibacter akesuensis]GHA67289.1 hypothetical protein GCM10007389_20560 [Pontibacter akesuensis]SFU72592.1 hypothetical protein SAMN04487941_2228 [Pontibacter akesuensis]